MGGEVQRHFQSNVRALNANLAVLATAGDALLTARRDGLEPFAAVFEAVGGEGQLAATVESAKKLIRPLDLDARDLIQTQYAFVRGALMALYEALDVRAVRGADPAIEAHELVEMLIQCVDLGAEQLVPLGDRLESQLRRRSWCRQLGTGGKSRCAADELRQLELPELRTQSIWRGHHQGVQLIGGSVAAASIIAPISSGASPSGGCQRLVAGLTERLLTSEFDSTRADADGSAMLEPGGWRPRMMAEFNIPIGRLNSPAPRFNAGLWRRTLGLPCRDLDRASTAIPTR